MARLGTETSDFGVSKREGHDSSKFYASRLYEGIKIDDTQEIIDNSIKIDPVLLNHLFSLDIENIRKIPDNSIHLIIFNVPSIAQSRDVEVKQFVEKIFTKISQLKQKMMIGARLVVIVDDQVERSISPSGYWPIHAHLATRIIELGLFMRGEVILINKERGKPEEQNSLTKIEPYTAHIKLIYSHGLIFGNGVSRRIKRDSKIGLVKTDTISRDQFLEYTKSVWDLEDSPEIEKGNYYSRFVQLYTFQEDTVLIFNQNEIESILKNLRPLGRRMLLFGEIIKR